MQGFLRAFGMGKFYIQFGKCAEEKPYCILQDKIYYKLCADFSVISQRWQEGQAGSLVLGVCSCSTLLGFFCRSWGFCRGPRNLHLLSQYWDWLRIRRKLSENRKTRQVKTNLGRAGQANLCSKTCKLSACPALPLWVAEGWQKSQNNSCSAIVMLLCCLCKWMWVLSQSGSGRLNSTAILMGEANKQFT